MDQVGASFALSTIAGGAPMWRWRFLAAPPGEVLSGERLGCKVGLTDEFGTEIHPTLALAILGHGFRVRCEVWSKGKTERLSAQRAVVTPSIDESGGILPQQRCRWRFNPLLPLDETADKEKTLQFLEVHIVGERPGGIVLNPLVIVDLASAPIIVTNKVHGESTAVTTTLKYCQRTFFFEPSLEGHLVPPFHVTAREDFGANMGAHVWNSSVVLGRWVCISRGLYWHALASGDNGKPSSQIYPKGSVDGGGGILELGSGCGVTGIVAAKLGALVMATDLDNTLELLRLNVALNSVAESTDSSTTKIFCRSKESEHATIAEEHRQASCCVKIAALDWKHPTTAALSGWGRFDLVIAADILYNPTQYPALLELLDKSGAPIALIALSHRNHGPAIAEATLRTADTPNTHPFFVLAANHTRQATSHVGDMGPPSAPTAQGQEYVLNFSWKTQSVYFFANVEVLEMKKIATDK